jgi:CheY-like chemotaxis protein
VGSEFFFDLTLAIDNTIYQNRLLPTLSPQNVLIIENNNTTRQLLKSMVINFGWNVEVADCCEAALLMIANKELHYFNLLLLDWSMPDVDGIQTVNRIQSQLSKEYCPIIIMVTAHDRGMLLNMFGSELADNIITKPLTESLLFNAVLEAKVNRGELLDNNPPRLSNKQLVGLNLLVVDDSEINREVAYQILVGEGANVETSENGHEAIALLIAKPDYFHVVLMDVQMPIMDGYTATKKIRMIPELMRLPIIALTAGAFKMHREAALVAGMNDFIAKPFDIDELITCIERQVYGRHRAKKAKTLLVIQTQPKTFDAIPLIEVERGLKKWRDVEFYQKHLRLFLQQHGQDAERIDTELSNGHQATAMEINHKLLGAAGALSLSRVVHFTKNIENIFSKKGDIESLFIDFAPIFQKTLDAINVYLASTTAQKTEQTTIDNANAVTQEELEQLITALNSDDLDIIESKLFPLANKLPKKPFDDLLTAVENFDFRQAEIIVNGLVTDKNNKEE